MFVNFVPMQLASLASSLLFLWPSLSPAVAAQRPSLAVASLEASTLDSAVLASAALASATPSSESTQFDQLRQTLENHDFSVVLALPPRTGTYGLLHVPTRTIWINPVVFDLGIAIPTLVHEAVHAAQLCSGSADTLGVLNLGLEPYAPAHRLYMRYTGIRRTLEAEAYTIQARPDRVAFVTQLLVERC